MSFCMLNTCLRNFSIVLKTYIVITIMNWVNTLANTAPATTIFMKNNIRVNQALRKCANQCQYDIVAKPCYYNFHVHYVMLCGPKRLFPHSLTFRLRKSSIFGFMCHWAAFTAMNGGPPKRLYPDNIVHTWSDPHAAQNGWRGHQRWESGDTFHQNQDVWL